MSSTNRGSTRRELDLYETPYWMCEAVMPRIKEILHHVEHPRIWEPCAGNGRITRVLEHFFPKALIYSTDIDAFDGIDDQVDFLKTSIANYPSDQVDLIITNPPFTFSAGIAQHAQNLVNKYGHVVVLEKLNFYGTKVRSPWLSRDVPNSNISPRRASFLPTGGCDSLEYMWMEFQSHSQSLKQPKSVGETRILPTMMCAGCGEVQYNKTCKFCNYVYCKDCFIDHTDEACKRNLFGKDSLWYCYNHPDRPMTNACRAKGCSLPFCTECWAEHAIGKWRACEAEKEEGLDA